MDEQQQAVEAAGFITRNWQWLTSTVALPVGYVLFKNRERKHGRLLTKKTNRYKILFRNLSSEWVNTTITSIGGWTSYPTP
jgi:hypothetical protein